MEQTQAELVGDAVPSLEQAGMRWGVNDGGRGQLRWWKI